MKKFFLTVLLVFSAILMNVIPPGSLELQAKERKDNIFKTLAQEKDLKWQESRSAHFYIYYKDVPMDFVKTVEESAENYYEETRRNLGFVRYEDWSFDQRAKIYIYRYQEDYVTSGSQAHWSNGSADARDKVIRTFPSAHGFFDSTLPHELGHIVFREFIGDDTKLPLWMEEGVAMFQEKAKRWGTNKIVKTAIAEKRFIPLEDLSNLRLNNNTDGAVIDLFYAEAASVIYYLITELGEYRFVQFCNNLKQGKAFNQALQSAYVRFDDIGDLNRAWVKYLESH